MEVYVLRCSEGKWYVGKTGNFKQRMEQHFSKEGGCKWTRLYEPEECVIRRPLQTEDDERNLTLKYMSKYGIENVRGGPYTDCYLSAERIAMLRNTLNGIICYRCYRAGHYANQCRAKTTLDGIVLSR